MKTGRNKRGIPMWYNGSSPDTLKWEPPQNAFSTEIFVKLLNLFVPSATQKVATSLDCWQNSINI